MSFLRYMACIILCNLTIIETLIMYMFTLKTICISGAKLSGVHLRPCERLYFLFTPITPNPRTTQNGRLFPVLRMFSMIVPCYVNRALISSMLCQRNSLRNYQVTLSRGRAFLLVLETGWNFVCDRYSPPF